MTGRLASRIRYRIGMVNATAFSPWRDDVITPSPESWNPPSTFVISFAKGLRRGRTTVSPNPMACHPWCSRQRVKRSSRLVSKLVYALQESTKTPELLSTQISLISRPYSVLDAVATGGSICCQLYPMEYTRRSLKSQSTVKNAITIRQVTLLRGNRFGMGTGGFITHPTLIAVPAWIDRNSASIVLVTASASSSVARGRRSWVMQSIKWRISMSYPPRQAKDMGSARSG